MRVSGVLWALGAARWLAVGAIFFLTAELVARVDDSLTWGAQLLSPYSHDRLLVQDSLGVRGRPNYRYQKWRMNNLGVRGPDMRLAPLPGTARVVALGASETFGLYESEGAEYPRRLQRLLDSLNPGRFEVINAGLPGMSLASMVPYFDQVVLPMHPQIVLVYPSPTFYLEVDPLPLVYTRPRSGRAQAPITLGPLALEPGFFDSRLIAKGRDVIKELVPAALVTAYRSRRLHRTIASHPAGWVWPDVPPDRMAILRSHLESLVDHMQDRGVEVILLTHTNRFIGASRPFPGSEQRHLMNLMSTYYPRASAETMVAVDSVANGILREVARKREARVIEIEGRIPPGPQFFADYAHFTDAGADRMARILAQRVLHLDSGGTASAGSSVAVPGNPR